MSWKKDDFITPHSPFKLDLIQTAAIAGVGHNSCCVQGVHLHLWIHTRHHLLCKPAVYGDHQSSHMVHRKLVDHTCDMHGLISWHAFSMKTLKPKPRPLITPKVASHLGQKCHFPVRMRRQSQIEVQSSGGLLCVCEWVRMPISWRLMVCVAAFSPSQIYSYNTVKIEWFLTM